MERRLFLFAAVAGFLAVAAGAFGSHALRHRLTPEMLAVFETGARYQMYHALATFAAAWGVARWPHRAFAAAGYLFLGGIVVFCGSLYLLVFTGQRAWGALTPVGGLAFLAGWLCLAWAAGSRLRS